MRTLATSFAAATFTFAMFTSAPMPALATPVPPSAVDRLDALEHRLDATWRAILSIQVALYNFETELSVDQKNRLKTMTFAAQD
jgi:hypothetical protein